jgi:isoaspartyl peptidase/L-asparaginase-like protein (Ntn-hydrolase superfamily)
MAGPVIVSTWSFAQRGNVAAWPALAGGGSSLDAVERVCRVIEDDAEVDSVGYGGLPDAQGVVTLDAAIMLAPDACGAVCGLRRHLEAISIARCVMERSPHVLLAGVDADAFAAAQGFDARPLLAPGAEATWRRWREKPGVVDQSRDAGYLPTRPVDTGETGQLFRWPNDPPNSGHDTICALALDRAGTLAGGCSTSGMPFKVPGRVGDVAGIGHGLYVDPAAGAATATGTGELVMGLCSSFHVVELMRAGATPLDALLTALARVADAHELAPEHQVAMIALGPDGAWASAALRPGYKCVVTDADGTALREPDAVVLA